MFLIWNNVIGLFWQGMDHNIGLTDEQDIAKYLERDGAKRTGDKKPPYEIIRDETVGR